MKETSKNSRKLIIIKIFYTNFHKLSTNFFMNMKKVLWTFDSVAENKQKVLWTFDSVAENKQKVLWTFDSAAENKTIAIIYD